MLSEEVPKMFCAFQSFNTPSGQYRPKLTMLTWRKCWHTCFCVDELGGDGNPEAGTVVDGDVTSVYNFDFYLQGMCV